MKATNNLTFVHNDLYGTALNIAKKFVSKSPSRPILQYCLLREDGVLFATNSHYAIQIKDIHGFKENFLINPFNNMQATGNYPDMRKVIEDFEGETVIKLDEENLKTWFQILKSMNQVLKSFKYRINEIDMEIGESSAIFSYLSGEAKTELNIEPTIESIGKKVAFQSEYMMNALETHIKLESKEVVLRFNERNKPFTLESEKVRVLIMPVRKYEGAQE